MAIYKIGRAEGNHIVLGDKSVSRQHAELEELGAGRFRIKDLGSSSGTHMLSGSDWVEVKETEVRHDTRIRFGEYETTPMDLVRDQDKTVVQAKPAAAALAAPPQPAAPKPAAPKPAPPKPAPPKPAPPRQAAPAPAPPRPAPPRPAPVAAPAGPRPPGSGMDKKTMWIIIAGGGALLLLALIAVVVVLATGGDSPTTEARRETPTTPAPRTETPTIPTPTTPTQPRRETPPPAAQGGAQRMAQACRGAWQGSDAVCQCVMRAVQPVLQEADYDDAIEVMTMVFTNKGDEARQKVQQMVAQGGQEKAQRIVTAVQAIGRDCKNVQ
jgi:hypothetical protein